MQGLVRLQGDRRRHRDAGWRAVRSVRALTGLPKAARDCTTLKLLPGPAALAGKYSLWKRPRQQHNRVTEARAP